MTSRTRGRISSLALVVAFAAIAGLSGLQSTGKYPAIKVSWAEGACQAVAGRCRRYTFQYASTQPQGAIPFLEGALRSQEEISEVEVVSNGVSFLISEGTDYLNVLKSRLERAFEESGH
jgi:hypothetical protein